MTRYALLPSAQWDRRGRVQDSPDATLVSAGDLGPAVDAATGRAHVLNIPSVARKLHRVSPRDGGGRVFIARERGRGGLLVEIVEPAGN